MYRYELRFNFILGTLPRNFCFNLTFYFQVFQTTIPGELKLYIFFQLKVHLIFPLNCKFETGICIRMFLRKRQAGISIKFFNYSKNIDLL